MLVLVPPTSMNSPSNTGQNGAAPATLAAGPDSTVKTGARRASATGTMSRSPCITIRGAWSPASRMLRSTHSSTSIMRGRMLALTAAV